MDLIEFLSREPNGGQMEFLKRVLGKRHFQPQECYWNAGRVVIDLACQALVDAKTAEDSKRLEYCEGYLTIHGKVLPHAWLVLDGNCVVELTARVREGEFPRSENRSFLKGYPLGSIPPGWRYRGLKIPTAEVARAWNTQGPKKGPVRTLSLTANNERSPPAVTPSPRRVPDMYSALRGVSNGRTQRAER